MISVSLIVKNESSCLAKCLESVKDADEIIICDTGSQDNTIEIAKKYTTWVLQTINGTITSQKPETMP